MSDFARLNRFISEKKNMTDPTSEKFISDAVNSYSDTVFRVAYSYAKNRCDAEDILQEVFLQLIKTRPDICGEQLKAWLIRVTINKSKDFLRSYKRRTAAMRGMRPHEEPKEYDDVFEALSKLSERDRNAIYLHYYEGYTAREIAGILGESERAVAKRVSRARIKLKDFLKEV